MLRVLTWDCLPDNLDFWIHAHVFLFWRSSTSLSNALTTLSWCYLGGAAHRLGREPHLHPSLSSFLIFLFLKTILSFPPFFDSLRTSRGMFILLVARTV